MPVVQRCRNCGYVHMVRGGPDVRNEIDIPICPECMDICRNPDADVQGPSGPPDKTLEPDPRSTP